MAAGLLNYDQPDPLTLGLLGFSQAISAPRSRGGGVAAALSAFPAGQMQAAEMRRRMEADELRKQLAQAQMENFRAAADERKTSAEERRAQLAQALAMQEGRQGVLSQLGPQPMGFRDASIAMGGAAPAGYTPPQQRQVQITPELAARYVANGGKIEDLKGIMESANFGREEVARVLERRSADNTPEQVMLDRFGRPVGGAIPKPFEMNMQDIGGSVVPVNPYAPTALTKSMTPDGVASNRVALGNLSVAQANLGLSRERLAMDRDSRASEGPFGKPPAGYRVRPDGSGLEPIPGGPADPAVDRNKPPTEAQSKDFLFASRAAAADKTIAGLKNPSIYGAALNANLDGFPIIGGALAGGQNAMLGDDTQKYMQAKRDFINAVLRKESGAVIGKDEFRSAELQYFPQPGDSPAVVQQKADNRQLAVQGIGIGAGPLSKALAAPAGYKPPTAQSGPSALPGQPSITDLVNKYAQPR
jgi:hypothetical protein